MANARAIHSVGESLRFSLQSAYPAQLAAEFPCAFQLLSTGQLANFDDPAEGTAVVSLLLYRVTFNDQLRNALQPGYTAPGLTPAVPVDLHWMASVWTTSAAAEQVVFAWLLRTMETLRLLDGSTLTTDGGWLQGDVVHVLPEELSVEDTMRIWDAFQPSYRLSATYVARVVRLDLDDVPPPRVLSTRMGLGTLAPRGTP